MQTYPSISMFKLKTMYIVTAWAVQLADPIITRQVSAN